MSRIAAGILTALLVSAAGTQVAFAAQPESSESATSSSAMGEVALASPAQYQAILKAKGLTQNESGTIAVDKPITVTGEPTEATTAATDAVSVTAAEPDITWNVVRTYRDKTGASVPLRSGPLSGDTARSPLSTISRVST